MPFQAFLMSPLALIKPSYRVRLLFKPFLSFFLNLSFSFGPLAISSFLTESACFLSLLKEFVCFFSFLFLYFSISLLPLVRLPSQVFLQCPLALQAFLEVRLPFQAFSRRLLASQAFILSLPGLTDLGLFRARVGTVQVIADGLATGAFPLSAEP